MGILDDDEASGRSLEARGIGLSRMAQEAAGGVWAAEEDFVRAFHSLIEALPEQIALVDEHWVILTVNSAWIKTAALYGYEALRPGTNYAVFCEEKLGEGHEAARSAVRGINEIEAGLRNSFHYLYDGSGRWDGFTFRLAINRLSVGGRTFATITRYDVTELVRLRRRSEGFSSSLIESQWQERRRIARELHDSTQQMLVSIALGLGQLKRTHRTKAARLNFDELQQLVTDVQREIRSIAYIAHPPAIENLGLRYAMEELVFGFGRRTGLTTTFHFEGEEVPTWAAAETALYRVVQEALSNVHRHAHASKMDVALYRRKSMIHAAVVDDGIGMPSVFSAGVGVTGMRARLAELGGRLLVRSQPHGTAIMASVPVRPRIRAVGDLAV